MHIQAENKWSLKKIEVTFEKYTECPINIAQQR